ncbi:MAG: hypothetical protein QOF67_3061 [Mycobacterium sp.]|jgi:rubredoxin|nr:hypothetical protein [Mycobacterium sp.]MDT5336009.1 hypothetical protein [Mycobacterium sp.]
MSVVERGTARCPRCMVHADYSFQEEDGGFLRYEVSCKPCGYVYVEDSSTPSVDTSAA